MVQVWTEYVGIKYRRKRDSDKPCRQRFISFRVPVYQIAYSTKERLKKTHLDPLGTRGQVNTDTTLIRTIVRLGHWLNEHQIGKVLSWMTEIGFLTYDRHTCYMLINAHAHYIENSKFLTKFKVWYLRIGTYQLRQELLRDAYLMQERCEAMWARRMRRPKKECLDAIKDENGAFVSKTIEWEVWRCPRCDSENTTRQANTYCRICSVTQWRDCKGQQRNLCDLDGIVEEDEGKDPTYKTDSNEQDMSDEEKADQQLTKKPKAKKGTKKKENEDKHNENVAVQREMNRGDNRPGPGPPGSYWSFVAIFPTNYKHLSSRRIADGIDLTNSRTNQYSRLLNVEKHPVFQAVIHRDLDRLPHTVLGPNGIEQLAAITKIKKKDFVVLRHNKNHFYDPSKPWLPVVVNQGKQNWNQGCWDDFSTKYLKQGFRWRTMQTMKEFVQNKNLMTEFVQMSIPDKRGLCAIQLGQNVQDGNAWSCLGENKPGLFKHSFHLSEDMKLFFRRMILCQHSLLCGALKGTDKENQGDPDLKCLYFNQDFISQLGWDIPKAKKIKMPEAATMQIGQSYIHVDSLNCTYPNREHVVIFTLYIKDLRKWLDPPEVKKLEKMGVHLEKTFLNVLFYARKHIKRAVLRRDERPVLSDYAEEMLSVINEFKMNKDDTVDIAEFHTHTVQKIFKKAKKKAQWVSDYPNGYIILQREGICRNLFIGSVAGHFLRWCLVYEVHLTWGHIDEFLAISSRYVNGPCLINGVLDVLTRTYSKECIKALKQRKPGSFFLFLELRMSLHGHREEVFKKCIRKDKLGMGAKFPRWQVGGESLFCYNRGGKGLEKAAEYVTFISDTMTRLRSTISQDDDLQAYISNIEECRALLCDANRRKQANIDCEEVNMGPLRGNLTIQLGAYVSAIPPDNAEYAYLGYGDNGYYKSIKYWLKESSEKRVTVDKLRKRAERERESIKTIGKMKTFTRAQEDQVNCRWARENLGKGKSWMGRDIIFLNENKEIATPPIRSNARAEEHGHGIQILIEDTWTNMDKYADYKGVGANAYDKMWKHDTRMRKITKALRLE